MCCINMCSETLKVNIINLISVLLKYTIALLNYGRFQWKWVLSGKMWDFTYVNFSVYIFFFRKITALMENSAMKS